MIDSIRRMLALALALGACASLLAATGQGSPRVADKADFLSLSFEISALGGGTAMSSRPLLPRDGYAVGGRIALGDSGWTWLALGLDWFALGESIPDASLFLYRGYGGTSLFAGTGPRFSLSGLGWKPLARSRLDIVGGAGIAATEDTGTTLVSLVPFLRLDSSLQTPITPYWKWSLGIPMEVQRRSTALTWLGGLSLAIVWNPTGGWTK